ncbi:Acyl-CoA thioesterase FadM [Halorubrum aquaticum]|uniref:Acyl-CoA thioesterase FadM n=1 Tax=Halorubrum aquaticum TaxID=387340 RepID=A0A1I3BYN2_9EURY|nr:thioesterase family protein [Halorubrum aquaticum]SFH66851.1 Acyl-CoA thioesterase FadM [Halorubrum aquaticum]
MQTIAHRRVRFGELAGSLVHGATFFDWLLVSTQEVADAFDYPFREILADDGIPYAPVVAGASVTRYPTVDDVVTVDAVPVNVGDSSVELLYEVADGDGEPLATARITHVTISRDGSALALPERIRSDLVDASVDHDPAVGPETEIDRSRDLPSFSSSFRIHGPHIEGANLAYFEEYPRFADIALERFLADRGTSVDELRGDKQPYRIRDWTWEFNSPVRSGSTLHVSCDVSSVDRDSIRIAHELSSDGRTSIEGVTEYGCFDGSGAPVQFDDAMLAPFDG